MSLPKEILDGLAKAGAQQVIDAPVRQRAPEPEKPAINLERNELLSIVATLVAGGKAPAMAIMLAREIVRVVDEDIAKKAIVPPALPVPAT